MIFLAAYKYCRCMYKLDLLMYTPYLKGLDQLCKDAEAMLGFAPGLYWRICWKFVSPALIAVSGLVYERKRHAKLKTD